MPAINAQVKPEELGCLVSKLTNPVDVEYDGGQIRLSPRGRTEPNLVKRLLGQLPVGVVFVPAR